ncbi:tRNA guanosine(15) transglycosylase TgtA [Methanohalophilus sp.]|uniref:tRNA guanosine(15) transglycosylase TgtA n=1 Tax=Methanohalophilus sp. TaxID=1966352 RepID=UPI00262E6DDE|nr:tRNA guanosine(15) transglycosylase TgtA [Methanohalophilus sp.]MDK2892167.1 7-cyano-7-deazaguanine tRNA-ribosyltransferase [Methanohalophilus sp.]
MPSVFKILQKDAAGRIGKLTTPHGVIETPTVMPVINPNIQTIPASEMRSFGAQILITNSYIIFRKEELREVALKDGLHSLLGFNGPIMTDSGSFQLSVYGDVEVTNEQIIEFQQKIGTDIGVPLDIPTAPDVSRDQAESELEITIERLKEARSMVKEGMLLAGPVQGSTYYDLRQYGAEELTRHNFDVYPIGAVVPLMENYRYAELVDVIAASKKGLSPVAPVHLFGAGHPMMFALAVALGCDLFDSAAYALYAKDGRYITNSGTYHIENLNYLPCCCPICLEHSAEELNKAPNKVELLARHNLYVTFQEINLIKQSIRDGNLLELVDMRCRSHPSMLEALKRFYSHTEWIETLDPASKSTFFYTGPESGLRPEINRYSKRLERLEIKGKALITSFPIKMSDEYDQYLRFKPPIGAYPIELSEMYPFNAEIPTTIDYEPMDKALINTINLISRNADAQFTFVCDDSLTKHPRFAELPKNVNVIIRGSTDTFSSQP